MASSLCRCIIRHAQTDEEREAIRKNLEYFRKIGDSTGTLLALAQLGSCPKPEAKNTRIRKRPR